MANTYDGGIVTAYGAAVRGGYNGTYEQFCTEQAQFGANAAAVAAAKIAVDSAKSQVDQTVNTFTQTTVPNAVSSVQSAGTEQIGLVQNAGTAQTQSVNSAGAAQVSAVQSEGSTQTHNVELTALSAIGQINDAQGDAVDAVETAETAATDAVTAAQTAAVQAVQTESTTQQAAVQAKGEQTIASIPADYTALSDDVSAVKSSLYTEISSGSKTQGGNYAINAINTGATLKAGETYELSLRFEGTFSSFLTYLNYLYMATGNSSGNRVDNIIALFRNIETPLSTYKWYTVDYTPTADVGWICPQYTSNYTPSDSNSISYKIVEKESRIDKLEQQIGDDDFYNFTPINTWEENAVPSAITRKLNVMANDVLCVFQGDSLTGLIEYSGEQAEPEHCPAGMQYKSWTYRLWENMARVKPLCDRLDSQRNGADFFTKTGTWEQVGGTKFDNDNYTWDFSQERSVACLTYQSASSDASVRFTLDADSNDKCNIVFSLKPDGADCQIEIAEGNGKMLVSLDRRTWSEANGFSHSQQSNPDGLTFAQVQSAGLAIQQRHRRLWMKTANGVTGNITITYKRASSSASGSYMYCWGTERWSGNTVFVDNIGRGGRYTRFLSYNISDILQMKLMMDCRIFTDTISNISCLAETTHIRHGQKTTRKFR